MNVLCQGVAVRAPRRSVGFWLVMLVSVTGLAAASPMLWNASLVKDINPSGYSNPRFLTQVGDTLFFEAQGDLWKSDGTESGTARLDLSGLPDFYAPNLVTAAMNGKLYYIRFFRDETGHISTELKVTDGTLEGTRLVASSPSGASLFNPLVADGTLWVFSGGTQCGIWKSDGTPSGTVQVRSWGVSGTIYGLGSYKGSVYFVLIGESDTVWQLWRSDGTWAGTTFVKNLPGPVYGIQFPYNAFVFQDKLWFFAVDASSVTNLWQSDGTPAGTQIFKPVLANILLAAEYHTALLNDEAMLTVNWEPWSEYAVAGNKMVFGVCTDTSTSVWKTDGTLGGTMKLAEIGGAPSVSPYRFPLGFTDTGGGVAFFTESFDSAAGQNQIALWKTDPEVSRVTLVKTFEAQPSRSWCTVTSCASVGGTLFFGLGNYGTWMSDGTNAGTTRVPGMPAPPDHAYGTWQLTNIGGRVFCSAYSSTTGQELWVIAPESPPTAAFTATPTTGPAPLTVEFTDLSVSTGAPITDWSWDFGDDQTSTEPNPVHVYDTNGAYTVTLTVSSEAGNDVAAKTWYIEVGDALPALHPGALALAALALFAAGRRALHRLAARG